jgi:hypothetical protein
MGLGEDEVILDFQRSSDVGGECNSELAPLSTRIEAKFTPAFQLAC